MIKRPSNSSGGFEAPEVLLGIVIVIVIGVIGSLLYVGLQSKPTSNEVNKPSVSSNSSTNSYAVLSPATVPSKTPECSQALTYSSDGNLGPLTCSNGELNVTAWQALAALEPKVMALGYNPIEAQVETDLCTDATDSNSDANTTSSNIIEGSTYQIAALYYGWHFTTDPSVELSNGSCK